MPAYRFRMDTGEIRYARRRVGSVRRAEDGVRFVGRIGQHAATARDATSAFREVAALAMGFTSAAALRAHNSSTRARNRARRYGAPLRFNAAPLPRPTPEAMIEALQQGAIEMGETPLTADQIMAYWRAAGGNDGR